MGRRRKHDRHLPQGMTCERGTHYFRGLDRQRVNLGKDFGAAMIEYARRMGPAPRMRTLHDVIEQYRLTVLPLKRSAQTREDDARALARLDAVFGYLQPDNLTAPQCYFYLDNRKGKDGKPAPVAARHEISLLGHVIAKAVRWGAATTNVVRTLERQTKTRRNRYVTDDEVAAVCKLASPRMRVAIQLARLIGQRRGDLLGIRREHITKDGILIRQGKTGAGVLIEISPAVQAVIDEAWRLAPQVPRDYLLRTGRGRPYTARGFSAIWQRLMAKYVRQGGKRFTFHDLRAKAASDMQSVEGAAALLGHASTDTTRRVYRRTLTRATPVE